MRNIIIAFSIMLGTLGAQAEVVPFNVFLSPTNYPSAPVSYTIPEGKIYLLEGFYVIALGIHPTNTEIRVSWKADNVPFSSGLTIPIADTYKNATIIWLPKPFRLKAGEILHLPQNADYLTCRYFGLMIDEADLYAQAIPAELQDVQTVGGEMLASVKYGSARPRITTIESAVDIHQFVADASGVEVAGLNREESLVSIDRSGENMKFLRVRATARN